ncbi:hypothetical protein LCGC14_2665610, partial [marine sediment metagenome]
MLSSVLLDIIIRTVVLLCSTLPYTLIYNND